MYTTPKTGTIHSNAILSLFDVKNSVLIHLYDIYFYILSIMLRHSYTLK